MSLKDFEILKNLGSGSFASVYKVKRISDGKEYAMKKVKMNKLKQKERENAVNEIRILASINDPNIIAYKDAFYDELSDCLCIVMEYADGGDLLNKINQHTKKGEFFDEDTIWKYFIQMLMGLKKLHSLQILHRDIKCANIFLTTDHVIKLGDLNVSKISKAGLVKTQIGTPYYASPEIWKDKPYDNKSDIWSIGCVLYELIALKPPFRASNMDGLYKKVIKGAYDKIPSRYSLDLSNVVASCLAVTPTNRPNCDQLLNNPIVVKRLGLIKATPSQVKLDINHANDLLGTIKMPRNLKALQQNLPKPKYEGNAHLSFDEESKENIPSLDQINIPSTANAKVRVSSSSDQRKKIISSANKENRPVSQPRKELSRPSARDDSNKNNKVSKSVAPQKKPGLPLPPSALGQKKVNISTDEKVANMVNKIPSNAVIKNVQPNLIR